jgi:4-hydroxybenzoyl-CoA reductase subunit beta
MPPFNLHVPSTLDEALSKASELSSAGKEYDWISGGTDLIPNYKWHINTKKDVISLSGVDELYVMEPLRIGAMVSLQEIVESDSVHPLISQAASKIASVMIRRSATLGGNICLDTRCFWFNQTEEWRESIDWCHKCDCGTGADCRVIPNQNDLCVATYQADLAPVLMCLGATIHLSSHDESRSMPISEFFRLDGMTRNVLKKGEIVTQITFPEDVFEWEGDYQKLRQRESWDFPEAGVAVTWRREGGVIEDLRVATTGLESVPVLHTEQAMEALEGWDGKDSVTKLSESVKRSVKPVLNTWYPPSYRKKMVKVLTRRACSALLEG